MTDSNDSVGEVLLDKYRIEGALEETSNQRVCLARDIATSQPVVVEFHLRSGAAPGDDALRRVRAALNVKSEHARRVLDVGQSVSGEPFVVREHLEAERLGAYLERSGPVAYPRAIDWLLQAAEAVAEAHEQQLVHAGLNIHTLVLQNQADGGVSVKVLGFGQLRPLTAPSPATLAGDASATEVTRPVAPEQLTGAPVDVRTDVWALGALLHEMLTGKPAFVGETYAAVAAQVIAGKVAPVTSAVSAVPAEVVSAIERCLRPRRDERFTDVVELTRELAPFGGETARVSLRRVEATFGLASSATKHAVQVNRSGARLPIFLGLGGVILLGVGMWSFTRSHVGDAKMHTTTPEQAQSALGAVVPPDERMDPTPSQTVSPGGTFTAPSTMGAELSPTSTDASSTTDGTL